MRIALLLLLLPTPAQDPKPLLKALTRVGPDRPGYALPVQMRPSTWYDALQDMATERGVDLRYGVAPLLRGNQ